MDLNKEVWHCELYKLQQQAPTPLVVKCNRKLDVKPPQYGDEYHGQIDRNDVETIMENYRTGAFLIRDSQRNVGAYTLVIRFDQSNKNYVLYYNQEKRQHYVGSKYFSNIIDLVQDGLIHMHIETRGADILRKIAEAKVYEATPFYQTRFYTIQQTNLCQLKSQKSQHHMDSMDNYGRLYNHRNKSFEKHLSSVEDINGSCDSGIFNSLRSDDCTHEKGDSSSEQSPQMSIKTVQEEDDGPPEAPPRRKSLYYSLRQKNTKRHTLSPDSPSSTLSSTFSQSTSGSHYEPIFDCRKTYAEEQFLKSQIDASLNSDNKSSQDSPISLQKSSGRHGLARLLSTKSAVIESSINSFSQIEKNHNFKQHTFVGPQWCDFCAHFMWGLVAQGVQCFDCGFQAHKKCSDKVAADCFPVMKRLKRVFGIALNSLAKMENRAVPLMFEKLIKTLEERDLTTQGLYRISGNIDVIEEVRAELDKDIDSVDLRSDRRLQDIENLTGLVKLFLRQLPIPLITSEMYTKLLSIIKLDRSSEKWSQIRDAMSILNSVHHATLEFFIRHLHKISSFHPLNCMTSSNLSIVFAPTIISKPDCTDTDMTPEKLMSMIQSDFKWDCTIIQELIDGCDSIFPSVPES